MSSPVTHVEAGALVSERSYLRQVFSWMILALAITTGVAVWFAASSNVVDYFDSHGAIFFIVLGLQLAMVFGLVGRSTASPPRWRRSSSASTPPSRA